MENALEGLQALDNEIARLEAKHSEGSLVEDSNIRTAILDLKYQRNAHVPLLKLPVDILLEITLIIIHGSVLDPMRWHQVNHVCRAWRDLVVGSPTCWTSPPPNHPQYALLALKRSGSAPLHVTIFKSDILPDLFRQMPRIQTLSIKSSQAVLEKAQDTLLSLDKYSSPLTSLSISRERQRGLRAHKPFFLKFAPFRFKFLRQLTLCDVTFDWDIFPIPTLTNLSLQDTRVVIAVTWNRLVQALGRMPLLESLELGLINIIALPSTTPSNPINLPLLTSLSIVEDSYQLSDIFLAQVTLPRLRKIGVVWPSDFEPHPGVMVQLSVAQLSRTVKSGNFPTLDELELTLDGFRLFSSNSREGAHVTIEFPLQDYISADDNYVALMQEIITTLASRTINNNGEFSALVKVTLIGDFDMSPLQFIELFGSLPRLKSIVVSELPLITQALRITSDRLSEISLPFATLKSIELPYVDDSRFLDGIDPNELDNFRTCIIQRRKYGVPIDYLTLYLAYVTGKQRMTLEGIFQTVSITDSE